MKNVIIIGSGRSGTSMIAGILNQNGYHLGKDFDYLSHRPANPNGFFEDKTVNDINEAIISNSVPKIPYSLKKFFPQFTDYGFRWLSRIPLWLPIKSTAVLDRQIKEVIDQENFCYKDPRFSFTLPVWNKNFSSDVKYLVIFRSPNKTCESILREYNESGIKNKVKMNPSMALKLWKNIYSHILKNYKYSSLKENWMFINYDQVFEKKYQKKISNFLETKMDFSFADKSLSRTNKIEIIKSKSVRKIYERLNELSKSK